MLVLLHLQSGSTEQDAEQWVVVGQHILNLQVPI